MAIKAGKKIGRVRWGSRKIVFISGKIVGGLGDTRNLH